VTNGELGGFLRGVRRPEERRRPFPVPLPTGGVAGALGKVGEAAVQVGLLVRVGHPQPQ
jgi:hypothetical protein